MESSRFEGDHAQLASRAERASAVARIGTVLAFVLPTFVAGAIVWNGALRLTKLDDRLKLERKRTRQVVDSLRHEIATLHPPELPRVDNVKRPGDTVRVRDTVRVGDTIRIRSADTIRIRTTTTVVDSARVIKLQQALTRANEANAACARNVKALQDSIARLNIVIKRLQGGGRPPLDIRRNQ
jgi:hypothetical protein